MKSKITKIQILLKKGITLALTTMLLAGPIAYATTSLDDNYLEGSVIDQILYGQIGSTAKEIEEYLENDNNTTLYITNETQLRALAEYVNSGNSCEGKKIILLNDIELDTEKEWIPIGRTESRFEGIFDGNGYTVKGIRFYRNDKTYSELTDVGFFGYIENATIQNVVIDDSKFGLQYNFPEDINDNFLWNKYDSLGALVGTSRLSNVINCKTTNSVDVNGSMNVGGIVGLTYQSTVKRCENNANATGILYVGGISGRTEGSLTGIKADTQVDFSKVDTTNGVRAAKILECINNGEVYVQLEAVGGITGTLEKFSIVQKCVNYGKVNLGNSTEINEAYCEGYTSQNAGGIVGWTSTRNDAANNKIVSAIDGCINYGSVIGYRDVGGLVGQLGGESGGIIILKDSINYTTDVSAYVTDEKKYTVGITKDGLIDSSAAYDGNFRVLLKGIVEKKLTSPGLIAGLLGAKLGENETLWYKYPEAGYIAGEVSCWGLDSSNSNSYINDPEVIVYNNYYVSNNGTDSLYSDVYDGKASNKISISGYEHQSSDEVMRAYGKIFDRVIGVYSKNNDGTYTLNSADYKTLFHSNGIETTNETTGETTITNETTIVSDENLNSYAPYLLKTESTTESSSDSLQLKYNLFNITTDNSGYTTSSTVNDKVLNIVKNNSAEGYVEEDNKYTISLDNDSNNNKLTQTIDSNNDLKVDYTIETEGNKTNLGVGDTITVTAKFNKYFETSEGTSYIPVLKINNEYEMTYKNVTDYTTTITYTYTIKDGDNFKVDELNITLAEGIYLVTSEGSTEISSSITANTVVTSNIVIDTMNPIINTKVYVENELATERYTAGKEILIEVTTSEEIQGDYTLPQIQVSFSESGEGRYNYSSDSGNVGYAKCKEAKINLNGTTTWIYSYQIQEGDEGYISIEYKSGEIEDLSGNVTEVKDLDIPIESKNQIKVSDIVFDISKDVKLSYKIYRNGTEVSYDNSLKKFDSGDKIKVVAIFNKAIYTQYGETASGTSSIKALTKEDAPTLELDDISFSCDNVSVTNYKTEITYSYTLTSDMKATMLKKLNIETYTYYYTDEDQTIENTNDNNSSNVTVKAKTISTDLSGLNLYVDNLGVENDIGDIYADTTAPTVTITANKSNPTNANEITYTFEFSEKVEGFDATDITVNGGEKAKDADEIVEFDEVKGEEGKEYTLVVNPTIENGNEGELQVIVESGACKDLVALDNVRAESVITIDRKAPTVEIRANKDKVNGTEAITYEFLWSEAVTGFDVGDIGDITVANGTKGTLSGSGNYYTLVVTPNGTNDVEVKVNAGACTDAAGNGNIASSKHVIAVVPTVTITTNRTNPTKESTITYTFEWSEPVTGFDTSDIILPNGVTGTLNGNTMTVNYSSIIPLGNEGEVTVAVKENAAQDSNGNTNAYSSLTTKIDRIAPTVEIRADKNKVVKGEAITYEFLWSESVTGFDVGDITINGKTISEATNVKDVAFSEGDNKDYYTLVVTPNEDNGNDIEVSIAKDKCTDAAGNNNIASSKHVIAVVPTVTITANRTNPTKESEIKYTFTWSETVTGFDSKDIILPNGISISDNDLNKESNTKYTLSLKYNGIIPLGNEGEVTVAVKENAVQDSNGNTNAYSSLTTKIDRIAPIFISLEAYADKENTAHISLNSEVDTVKQHYKAGEKVVIVATFTENVEESTDPILALQFSESGNAKGNVEVVSREENKEGNKIKYIYTITDKDSGTLSVKGFSGTVVDAAGNETIVTKRTLEGDTIIADTTNPTLEGITVIAPEFEYDELIKDGETKRYGTISKTRNKNTITIIAEYSENIYNLSSNKINKITDSTDPVLKIKFGEGNNKEAIFSKVEGNKIYYTYDITSDITSGDNGDLSIISLVGKVCDIAGNECETTTETDLPEEDLYENEIKEENEITKITADTKSENIDITSVTAINYDDKNNVITGNEIGDIAYYRKGAVITIIVKTNEYVYYEQDKALTRFENSNAPQLNVSFDKSGVGKGTVNCTNVDYKVEDGKNRTIFTYTYTVEDTDTGYLKLEIPVLKGYDIALNGNSKKNENKTSIIVDTTRPYIAENTNGISQWEITSTRTSITAVGIFTEKLYVMKNYNLSELNNPEDAPLMAVKADGEIKGYAEPIITVEDGKTKLTYTYDISSIDANSISVNVIDGTLYDIAGNEWSLEIGADTSSPTFGNIQVLTENGFYKKGETIEIVVRFNEVTELTKVPKLTIKLGDKEIEINGTINKNDELNTSLVKVARYTYPIDDENGALNIISLIGEANDGVRPRVISQIYIDINEDGKNDVNGLAQQLLNSNGTNYANNKEEYENVFADTTRPFIESVTVKAKLENENDVLAEYNKQEAKVEFGRTNANEIEYVVKFSELVRIIDGYGIKLYNAEKVEILNNDSNHDGYYDEITIKAKTTIEGVQSLIISDNAIEDRAGNTNLLERFNILTTDFTLPTVRFISEYNGGIYVLPTNIGKIEIRPNVEISEDIYSIEYAWDKEEYKTINNYSSSSDIAIPTKTFTADGTYKLNIRVTDLAGNVAITSKTYRVINSNINITLSTEEYTNENITATVKFGEGLTDNRKVTFKAEDSNELIVLNAAGIDSEGNVQYTIETNGTIYAEATDRVGNKVFYMYNNESGHPILNIDTEKPKIELSLNGANLVIGTGKEKATIKTNVETSDNNSGEEAKYVFMTENIDISGYEYMTEEQKIAIKSKITNTLEFVEAEGYKVQIEAGSTKDKPYYLYVIATDVAGNETVVKSEPFTVVDTNEDTITNDAGEETIVPAEKPVSELIIFKRIEEDWEEEVKDKEYIGVKYEDTIIKSSEITVNPKENGFENDNIIEVYGPAIIEVRAWDACGNEVINKREITKDDIQGPEFTISGNPEGWTNGDVELEIYSNAELTTLTKNGENILGDNKYRVNTDITGYGEYTFEATDIYGNTSEQTVEVKIDKSKPEITDVEIEENGDIVIIANDIDKTLNRELSGLSEYAITDTTEVPVEWSESNVIKVTKDENFFVWAKDNAGNITTKEQIVVRDTVAPELTITTDSELDKWTNADIKIDVDTNEELSSLVVKYKEMEEQDGQQVEVQREVDILKNKTYTITSNGTYEVIGVDKSGNITKETIEISKIDRDAPVISKVEPQGKDIAITATDDGSEIKEYAISTTTEVPVEWSKSNVIKVTEDGKFYAWVKDNAGNISIATTKDENENIIVKEIIVDTTAPTVTFNYLSQTITVGMPLEATIITNEDATISYSWDKETWIDSTELLTSLKVSQKSITIGKYTLYAKAKDSNNNESKVEVLEFNVVNMEEIKQPEIIFEDISTIQVNGVKYVKVSPNTSIEYLTNRMNKVALCGKTPEFIKLTEDGKLRTGSEITINGSTKYIVVVKGDVNCDGGIDFIKDIIRANNYRLGMIDLSIPQILAADVNNDGKIEFIQDIIAINNYRLGLIKSL